MGTIAILTITVWVLVLLVIAWIIYGEITHDRKLSAANKAAAKPIKYRRFTPSTQGK